MKQNTKFLWIYILILFSFALILIVFAGLSHNTEDEQQRGLREDITELSQKNTELTSVANELQTQIDALNTELVTVKGENDTMKVNQTSRDNCDTILLDALKAHEAGDEEKCRTSLDTLSGQQLTGLQQYIYDYLKNEHK